MKKQVGADHYNFENYIAKGRFISYWHQINEVLALRPKRVLEIGPGPGITTNILRAQGLEVVTCDLADDLDADVRASVLDLPFRQNEFDVVLCCQVLEHMPFDDSLKALRQINKVCSTGCIISLPQAGRFFPISTYIPGIGRMDFGFNLQFSRREHQFDGQHYWEIDKKGYPEAFVRKHCSEIFRTVRSFRVYEYHYHRFYVLLK